MDAYEPDPTTAPARVRVETWVRVRGDLRPISELTRYDGDRRYVPGAIVLAVDDVEVLSLDLWDDVNWLWPSLVRSLDVCRRTGAGQTGFPDQPITFRVERMPRWPGQVLVTVTDGGALRRRAVAPERELFAAVARAGRAFFDGFGRFCDVDAPREESMLAAWLTT